MQTTRWNERRKEHGIQCSREIPDHRQGVHSIGRRRNRPVMVGDQTTRRLHSTIPTSRRSQGLGLMRRVVVEGLRLLSTEWSGNRDEIQAPCRTARREVACTQMLDSTKESPLLMRDGILERDLVLNPASELLFDGTARRQVASHSSMATSRARATRTGVAQRRGGESCGWPATVVQRRLLDTILLPISSLSSSNKRGTSRARPPRGH
ncbi:hypothetical protein B0I37DRAFT_99639 [Chaetomium sp. MPI-CAGE-AT-0009]|nr:hypothetical protein B0I37DRAFT_99639 [Chaetomium sp. MPI-CAGE-AT-0009]